MKVRVEPQGIHYYDRKSGTHILFDEVKPTKNQFSVAPRTVSIAITDECDFRCSYCYVNLKDRYLPKEIIISLCKQLDKLGTFDVAFGGGEPTLHPDLITICSEIWNNTELGISITTHGHNLTEQHIQQLKNVISFIRVSIDGVEPIYSKLRKKPLSKLLPNLELLSGQIPFGINTVVNKLTVENLGAVKELFLRYNAFELLLLPMWHKGSFALTEREWIILNNWILENYQEIPIRVSIEAKPFLNLPFLFPDEEWDNDYAFIGIDKTFRKNSFTREGKQISDEQTLENILQERSFN